MSSNNVKGIIYLLITAIIWGGAFVAQLFGGNAIGAYLFTTYRCILGCITIAVMIYFDNIKKTGKFSFFRQDEDKTLTIKNSLWCGVVLFFAIITQQIGVEMTDTAKSGLITSLEVICVPIILFIVYGRKIRLITLLFIVTSMLGIMMLGLNSVSKLNIGDLWVFVSTILYSITIIQVPKYVKNIDPLKFSFFRFIVVIILGAFFAKVFNKNEVSMEQLKEALPSIFYSGVLSAGVAYTFSIIGQQYCEPIIATLIMSLEGIFAAIFGWIILGQSLNFIQITGILISFISIVVVHITDNAKYIQ